jgi:phage terminase large subunit-like protein
VAALYEQGKVPHVGFFIELEDQPYSYVAGDGPSPDRYDALLRALTELAIKDEPGLLRMYREELARRQAQH